MYVKTIPYRTFSKNPKPKNGEIHLNLTIGEVAALLPEILAVNKWLTEQGKGEERVLSNEDVSEFYTQFENLLLEAWGVPEEDGEYFEKGGKFRFRASALFAGTMEFLITNPAEVAIAFSEMLPEGMEEIVNKQEAALAKLAAENVGDDEKTRQIEDLQRQLREAQASGSTPE